MEDGDRGGLRGVPDYLVRVSGRTGVPRCPRQVVVPLRDGAAVHSERTSMAENRSLVLPATQPRETVAAGLRERAPWFYPLAFSNGASAEGVDDAVAQIHRTRTDAIFSLLDRLFGHRWDTVRCLDI